jgi:hypothetical protein
MRAALQRFAGGRTRRPHRPHLFRPPRYFEGSILLNYQLFLASYNNIRKENFKYIYKKNSLYMYI